MKGHEVIKSIIRKCDRGMDHTINWEEVQDPLVYVGLLQYFLVIKTAPNGAA